MCLLKARSTQQTAGTGTDRQIGVEISIRRGVTPKGALARRKWNFTAGDGGNMVAGPRREVVLEVAARKQTGRQTGQEGVSRQRWRAGVSTATGGVTPTSAAAAAAAGRSGREESGVLNERNWTRGPESRRGQGCVIGSVGADGGAEAEADLWRRMGMLGAGSESLSVKKTLKSDRNSRVSLVGWDPSRGLPSAMADCC